MRVVLLVEYLGLGGLANYVLGLACLLRDAGCSVVVAHGNAPLPRHLEIDGLDMMHLPGLVPTAGRAKADAAVRDLVAWAPAVINVHLCSSVAAIEGLLASGVPLVRSFHDLTSLCLRRGRRRWPGDRCQRALHWSCVGWGCLVSPPRDGAKLPHVADVSQKLAERNRYRDFPVSIACSTFIARTLELNGFCRSRIRVVTNFSRFDRDAVGSEPFERPPGLPGRDRPLELLFSGQAVVGKGLEVLIAALKGIEAKWRLTVLAEGPRLGPAQALSASFGLLDRIDFIGWVPQAETTRHYRNADLLVMPSIIDEALPLVGLEAMSFGTPLLGFAVGGIPDYLIDDHTGILVPEVNANGLRAGLERVLGAPDRIAAWGRNGRHRVARAHRRDTHLRAMLTAYRAAGCKADTLLAGMGLLEAVER